eukprot:82365_1
MWRSTKSFDVLVHWQPCRMIGHMYNQFFQNITGIQCDQKEPGFSECNATVRIKFILTEIDPTSHSKQHLEQFIRALMVNTYTSKSLLNDFNHIKYEHRVDDDDHAFDQCYIYLADGVTTKDVNTCDIQHCPYYRQYKQRSKPETPVTPHEDHKESTETEQYMTDLLTGIHVYFIHSYQIHRVTPTELDDIDNAMDRKQSDDDALQDQKMILIADKLTAKRINVDLPRDKQKYVQYQPHTTPCVVDFEAVYSILKKHKISIAMTHIESAFCKYKHKEDKHRFIADIIDAFFALNDEELQANSINTNELKCDKETRRNVYKYILYEYFEQKDINNANWIKIAEHIITGWKSQIDLNKFRAIALERNINGHIFIKESTQFRNSIKFAPMFKAIDGYNRKQFAKLYRNMNSPWNAHSSNIDYSAEMKAIHGVFTRNDILIQMRDVHSLFTTHQLHDAAAIAKVMIESYYTLKYKHKYTSNHDHILRRYLSSCGDPKSITIYRTILLDHFHKHTINIQNVIQMTELIISKAHPHIHLDCGAWRQIAAKAQISERMFVKGETEYKSGTQFAKLFGETAGYNKKHFQNIYGVIRNLYKEWTISIEPVPSQHEEPSDIYEIGTRFYYWDSMRHDTHYIAAHYRHLKDEVLQNKLIPIDIPRWDRLFHQCTTDIETDIVRQIKHNGNHDSMYDILQSDPLSMHHLCALKMYLDYTTESGEFCKILRNGNPGAVAEIAIRTQLLSECVQCYGSLLTDNKQKYYRGVTSEFKFDWISTEFNLPTSTSISFHTAVWFADNGLVLELRKDWPWRHDVYKFDCCKLSAFYTEKETLFFGGNTILRISSIYQHVRHDPIHNGQWTSYRKYMEPMNAISRMVHGLTYKHQQMMHDLMDKNHALVLTPYIAKLLAHYTSYNTIVLLYHELLGDYHWMDTFVARRKGKQWLNIFNICTFFSESEHIIFRMADDRNVDWRLHVKADFKAMGKRNMNTIITFEWPVKIPERSRKDIDEYVQTLSEMHWITTFSPDSVSFQFVRLIRPQPRVDEAHKSEPLRLNPVDDRKAPNLEMEITKMELEHQDWKSILYMVYLRCEIERKLNNQLSYVIHFASKERADEWTNYVKQKCDENDYDKYKHPISDSFRALYHAITKREYLSKHYRLHQEEEEPHRSEHEYKIGCKVNVYSASEKKRTEGRLVKIVYDNEGQWLEVQYMIDGKYRTKQIPPDHDDVRPLYDRRSRTSLQQSQSAMVRHSNTKTRSVDPESNIRSKWTIGCQVEVYSKISKQWIKGEIKRILIDDEGEWLEVEYVIKQTIRMKQVQRDANAMIRPVHLIQRLKDSIRNTITVRNPKYVDTDYIIVTHTNEAHNTIDFSAALDQCGGDWKSALYDVHMYCIIEAEMCPSLTYNLTFKDTQRMNEYNKYFKLNHHKCFKLNPEHRIVDSILVYHHYTIAVSHIIKSYHISKSFKLSMVFMINKRFPDYDTEFSLADIETQLAQYQIDPVKRILIGNCLNTTIASIWATISKHKRKTNQIRGTMVLLFKLNANTHESNQCTMLIYNPDRVRRFQSTQLFRANDKSKQVDAIAKRYSILPGIPDDHWSFFVLKFEYLHKQCVKCHWKIDGKTLRFFPEHMESVWWRYFVMESHDINQLIRHHKYRHQYGVGLYDASFCELYHAMTKKRFLSTHYYREYGLNTTADDEKQSVFKFNSMKEEFISNTLHPMSLESYNEIETKCQSDHAQKDQNANIISREELIALTLLTYKAYNYSKHIRKPCFYHWHRTLQEAMHYTAIKSEQGKKLWKAQNGWRFFKSLTRMAYDPILFSFNEDQEGQLCGDKGIMVETKDVVGIPLGEDKWCCFNTTYTMQRIHIKTHKSEDRVRYLQCSLQSLGDAVPLGDINTFRFGNGIGEEEMHQDVIDLLDFDPNILTRRTQYKKLNLLQRIFFELRQHYIIAPIWDIRSDDIECCTALQRQYILEMHVFANMDPQCDSYTYRQRIIEFILNQNMMAVDGLLCTQIVDYIRGMEYKEYSITTRRLDDFYHGIIKYKSIKKCNTTQLVYILEKHILPQIDARSSSIAHYKAIMEYIVTHELNGQSFVHDDAQIFSDHIATYIKQNTATIADTSDDHASFVKTVKKCIDKHQETYYKPKKKRIYKLDRTQMVEYFESTNFDWTRFNDMSKPDFIKHILSNKLGIKAISGKKLYDIIHKRMQRRKGKERNTGNGNTDFVDLHQAITKWESNKISESHSILEYKLRHTKYSAFDVLFGPFESMIERVGELGPVFEMQLDERQQYLVEEHPPSAFRLYILDPSSGRVIMKYKSGKPSFKIDISKVVKHAHAMNLKYKISLTYGEYKLMSRLKTVSVSDKDIKVERMLDEMLKVSQKKVDNVKHTKKSKSQKRSRSSKKKHKPPFLSFS